MTKQELRLRKQIFTMSRTGNLKGPIKLTTYDPNDVARTTIKETNIHDVRTGNVGGISKGGAYITNEMEAPNTIDNLQVTMNTKVLLTVKERVLVILQMKKKL